MFAYARVVPLTALSDTGEGAGSRSTVVSTGAESDPPHHATATGDEAVVMAVLATPDASYAVATGFKQSIRKFCLMSERGLFLADAEFADQISPQTVPWSETNLLREPPALEPLFDSAFLPQRIVRTVELFQNERYSPRLGFSFKSLLLLDRDAISNAEGTMW